MDLRCRKTNCKYNNNLTCKANNIEITNKMVCSKYQKEANKNIDISKHIFDSESPFIADYKHLKVFNLQCNCDCLFNKDGKCISNGITINELNEKPKCISYAKK